MHFALVCASVNPTQPVISSPTINKYFHSIILITSAAAAMAAYGQAGERRREEYEFDQQHAQYVDEDPFGGSGRIGILSYGTARGRGRSTRAQNSRGRGRGKSSGAGTTTTHSKRNARSRTAEPRTIIMSAHQQLSALQARQELVQKSQTGQLQIPTISETLSVEAADDVQSLDDRIAARQNLAAQQRAVEARNVPQVPDDEGNDPSDVTPEMLQDFIKSIGAGEQLLGSLDASR